MSESIKQDMANLIDNAGSSIAGPALIVTPAEVQAWLDYIEQLEREREALTPPAHGEHGGPLVRITATYEDGSTHEIPREAAERARDGQ
ncbi:MAG: hypothetical protein AAF432_00650 [Planctomycetota bacterium]